MTGDPIMEVTEGDAAGEDIPAGIPAEGVAVTAGRAAKATKSGRKCTSC
jgi:hypothetical protein